jgi:transcriptional regulator with XRE-family HTH domain
MQTVGQRIRAARELAGYTRQGDFAKAVGCSQSTLSEIESGDTKIPSGKVLQKMAEVLGKTERWIIYGEDGAVETPTAEEQDILSDLRALPDDVRRSLASTIKTLARTP